MESIVQQALENYGFKIAPRIGWGGFAEVHEAYSAEGVPCAIKVSLHPLDEADSEIRRELENLNYLKMLPGHPRIVTLMDIWMIGGYLVTRWELAPGEGELAPGKKIRSLEDMLRYYELVGQQGIPLSKLIRYIYETAQAIDFLNEKGIYHRDIKPSNLLLFWDRVKVGDVGLAKFIGASIGSHSRLGTLGYLPLEAWDQGVLHPTVDIYSLAATYVKLRTGREPFGTKPKEILDNQTLGKPCLEGLGDAEKLVVMQALAADPAARPQHGAVQWVRELYAAIRAPDSPPPLGPVSQMVVSDAHSLIRAVANAPPGAIIYLQPGTYRLPKGLQIKKSLLLRGSGKENTYILVDTPGRAAISYLGTGLFSVRDLSVEYIGLGPADVLSASSGVVDIRNCVFQGGKWADGSGVFGAGVRLQGIVRGTLHGCICRKNTYGICVSEQAQPTLEENQCLENATGIAYFGTSSGVARKNICQKNQDHGIQVSEQAQPTLEENQCLENLATGIAYFGTSSGVARKNICQKNQLQGIAVSEQAQPTLEENQCLENLATGIAYFGTSSGVARKNICQKNQLQGIAVSGQAQPTLEENQCIENQDCGIVYLWSSSGIARKNICQKNQYHGIQVSEQSHPTLEENQCLENEDTGIVFFDNSSGTADRNICRKNAKHGISIEDQAEPGVVGNKCLQNGKNGIAYSNYSKGTARNNLCGGNGRRGIQVSQNASPTLEKNRCVKNKGAGIAYVDQSEGIARKNRCIENGYTGIFVTDDSNPTIEHCQCVRNKDCGIAFWGRSQGLVKGNICTANEQYGIYIAGASQPILQENHCSENKKAGIGYGGSQGGKAQYNLCKGNGTYGICVGGNAQPLLEENQCLENVQAGIVYKDNSGGVARRNICLRNDKQGIHIEDEAAPLLEDNQLDTPLPGRKESPV